MKIDLADFVFLTSAGHYVEIYHLDKAKQIIKAVFRNSLREIGDIILKQEIIIQCHRSHIVNINHVEKIYGTSRNKKLKIKGVSKEIPVSRNQIAFFENLISPTN